MHNEKGFILIQSLIAFSIVFMLVITITPGVMLIKKEQHVLQQRLKNIHYTHDLLITELSESEHKNKIGNYATLEYEIVYEGDYVKVCSSWMNIKEVKENRCYYGKKEKV